MRTHAQIKREAAIEMLMSGYYGCGAFEMRDLLRRMGYERVSQIPDERLGEFIERVRLHIEEYYA